MLLLNFGVTVRVCVCGSLAHMCVRLAHVALCIDHTYIESGACRNGTQPMKVLRPAPRLARAQRLFAFVVVVVFALGLAWRIGSTNASATRAVALEPPRAVASPAVVPPAAPSALEQHEEKTVLIGILTIPGKTAIRSAIRWAFARHSPRIKARASLYFVVGQPLSHSDALIIGSESREFGDLMVLNITENMNNGKTYEFFVAAEAVRPVHRFFMKADDDAYIHVPNLVATLDSFPRGALVYYGRFCKAPRDVLFMCGMAYGLSATMFALVPRPPRELKGHEDQITNAWVRADGERAYNVTRYSDDRFYDYENAAVNSGPWKRPFQPGNGTIVVHQLKSVSAYVEAVAFFQPAALEPL